MVTGIDAGDDTRLQDLETAVLGLKAILVASARDATPIVLKLEAKPSTAIIADEWLHTGDMFLIYLVTS